MNHHRFSKRSIERMSGVCEEMREIAHEALRLSPIDFGIPNLGGWRSDIEQNDLFKSGKSLCDGYEKRSRHQDGKALDVYAYVGGRASWADSYMSLIACSFYQAAINLGYRIEWGGLWTKFKDKPHFELI